MTVALLRRQLFVLSCLISPLFAQAAPSYLVTPLGSLGGGSGDVRRLNNDGLVVGYALSNDNRTTAYLSADGAMVGLPPANKSRSQATGINDAGTVSGFVDIGGVSEAVTWSGGTVTRVAALAGLNSAAAGINWRGQLAGTVNREDGSQWAFLNTPGALLQDLGTLGGLNSSARDINAAGMVAGSADVDNGYAHAFRYVDGQMTDLGTLGGQYSEAHAINDHGVVAGTAAVGDIGQHAFLYRDGSMHDLSTLGGINSYAYGVNNAGQAVGTSEIAGDNTMHAFLYTDGTMLDLNQLVDPDLGLTFRYAADINERGQIAALGCTAMRECDGYLLTLNSPVPEVPEPGMPLLLTLGLGVLGLRLRRAKQCR